jgi:two-component system, cell cycle response regulator DivK
VTTSSPGARARGVAADRLPLVLIVDDNEKNLKLARDVLRAAGLRTLEAASGSEGLALAAEQLPDVILLDLRLRDMDGIDVAQELRSGGKTARIPIVAVSALQAEADADWLRAAGFAGYLKKPISIGEFPEQVRSYCADPRSE